MFGQFRRQAQHNFGKHVLRLHALDQQTVDTLGNAARLTQQRRFARSLVTQFGAEKKPKLQQAIDRVHGLGNGCTFTDRVEQRAERFIKVEVTHNGHARQQQAIAARTHERLGHRAYRTLAGQKQSQPRKAKTVFAITRDQAGDERIGKAPMRRDRPDPRTMGAGGHVNRAAAQPR